MEQMLVKTGFSPGDIAREETLFHNANGYIGVRGCLEEGVPGGVKSIRGTYLNAFYDLKPIAYGEKLYGFPTEQECMVNVVDVQTVRLRIGDELFSPFAGMVHASERTLDMRRGVTERKVRWQSPNGSTLHIHITRMASFANPNLFLLRYAVESENFTGPLAFTSLQNGDVTAYADPNDPRVSQTPHRHIEVTHTQRVDGVDVMTCRTLSSHFQMTSAVAHRLQGGARTADDLCCDIQPGGVAVLEKWCVFTDGRRYENPESEAIRLLHEALETPLDGWLAKQRAYLDAFWRNARVVIDGDDALQSAVDFSLYQLLQSAGRDTLSNVAAKGLSGEGYEGHYFWDTEIFILPFFLLTDRARAKRLLSYRHGILDAARVHARSLGHTRGALYPWRTIAGRECSGYFPSGSAQYHINGDVAHAFAQYWQLTGDLDFMAEKGAEVLVETARLWLDVGHMHDGTFRIDDVTGPDEYTCVVNNNYYTNVSARENLRCAAEAYDALQAAGRLDALLAQTGVTADEIDAMREAAAHMYLPYDEALGIYAQDDTFLQKARLDLSALPADHFPLLLHYHPLFLYRHQVLKQADAVLAHCLYEDGVSEADMRRTYDYYEPITTHDSSLSPCIYGIMAARLGDMDKAMRYFRMTARMDLDDTHGNTADGLHTANLGGVYLGLVMGFAGLRVGRTGVSLRPCLPDGIGALSFAFIVQNSRVRCELSSAGCALTLLEGEPVTIFVDGQAILVQSKEVAHAD